MPKKVQGHYIEPFVGGGAVFFHLAPSRAVIGDTNVGLMETYQAIRDHCEGVVRKLIRHHKNHDEAYYYLMRSSRPTSLVGRAAQFIYLNRTCFNGIYRVNLNGRFNVPIGSKTSVILPYDDFDGWSKALQKSAVYCSDFASLIEPAGRGDFVLVDPPYTVRHNVNGFIKYNELLFSWEDQERLAEALHLARRRGARILMTNAYHHSVRKLYRKGFKQVRIQRFSSISGKWEGRGIFDELVVLA